MGCISDILRISSGDNWLDWSESLSWSPPSVEKTNKASLLSKEKLGPVANGDIVCVHTLIAATFSDHSTISRKTAGLCILQALHLLPFRVADFSA